MNAVKTPTCTDLIESELESRIEALNALLDAYENDPEVYTDEGRLDEYPLEFAFAPKGGYFRYLIGTGGPHDEIRFSVDLTSMELCSATYVYKDWFDGATIEVTHADRPQQYNTLSRLWSALEELARYEYLTHCKAACDEYGWY